MAWIQIEIDITVAQALAMAGELEHAGAKSVTLQAASSEALFDRDRMDDPVDEAPSLWERTRVIGLFPETTDTVRLLKRLRQAFTPTLFHDQIRLLADQDWVAAYQQGLQPQQFGTRLWVCPGDTPPPRPEAVNVILDPGMAFGTGSHETTTLCLNWLDAAAGLWDKTVVDYGCGSGILAIAAAKLGAKQVWAVDSDPQALAVAESNVERNGLMEKVSVGLPDLIRFAQADVLLANILLTPLLALAPRLARLCRDQLVLSGLLLEQTVACAEAYRGWFNFQPVTQLNGWALLEGHRSS